MKQVMTVKQQFNNITQLPMFEIEVVDKRTNEVTNVIFDISIQGDKFIAQHESFNKEESESTKIAFSECDIDEDFTLNSNLQELYSCCIEDIIMSEYYELPM